MFEYQMEFVVTVHTVYTQKDACNISSGHETQEPAVNKSDPI